MSAAIWAAPFAIAAPALVVVSVLSLPEPQTDRVAAVVFPFSSGMAGFSALLEKEPNLALVGFAWGERVVFVVPTQPDFRSRAAAVGGLISFEIGALACGKRETQ